MKKKIVVVAFLICITASLGAEKAAVSTDPAALVPDTAVLFAQSVELEKAIPAALFLIENFTSEKALKSFADWRATFKKKTGVDPADAASLSRAGVDVSRPAGMAYLKSEDRSQKIMILVPVKNEKTFPLKFAEVLKKYNQGKPDLDLNPSMTRYKNRVVYQIMKDIFFSAMDGYLVVASSGKIITDMIDGRAAEAAGPSLSGDPLYADYLAKGQKWGELNVFVKKEFLAMALAQPPSAETLKKKKSKGPAEGEGENEKDNSGEEEGKSDRAPRTGPPQPLEFEFVEYMALGVKRERSGVSLLAGVSLKKETDEAEVFTRLFKPGLPERVIPVDEPLAYHYLSLDLKALNDLCAGKEGKGLKPCADIDKMKSSVAKEFGIDLDDDFIPYFGGYINAGVRKSKIAGTVDNFTVFLPMMPEQKAVSFWKKLRSAVKTKQASAEDGFGEEKIDAIPSFWYKDKRGVKISFIAHGEGLYVGNNIEFLRSAMSDRRNFFDFTDIEFMRNPDPSVFLLSYLKIDSESYLKALLMLLAYNVNPQLYALINRIDRFSLIGRRADNYFSVNFSVFLMPKTAAGKQP